MKKIMMLLLITFTFSCSTAQIQATDNQTKDESSKVLVANDRDYFPVLHDLVTNAKETIKVVLFQSRYDYRGRE